MTPCLGSSHRVPRGSIPQAQRPPSLRWRKAPRPFDSQAEWDEAVVEAKTSHINRGYDISVYNDEQGVDHGTPPPEHGLTGGQGVACKLESRAGAHRLAEIPPRCLFSVVFSQRISLPQHSRKKGSEFVCSMFAHLP